MRSLIFYDRGNAAFFEDAEKSVRAILTDIRSIKRQNRKTVLPLYYRKFLGSGRIAKRFFERTLCVLLYPLKHRHIGDRRIYADRAAALIDLAGRGQLPLAVRKIDIALPLV